MAFPVDILATVDPGSLEQSAKSYMSKLLCKNSQIPDYLSVPGSKNVEISLCNVSFVPLYGADIKEKILAVFSPEKPLKAVGLYLLEHWWSAEDILKTADSSRTGLIQVSTPGERIVLYVLNRIIYRTEELVGNDVPFPCHGEDEIAKILWKNGEAIAFYSVKPEVPVRLSNTFLTQRYQLPVMDTIFIRECHRGHGHGLQMLKDFVNSFKKDFMGLSYPLSPAMYKVCKKYLSLYPEDTELLWEIVREGSPFQKARKIQATDPKGNDHGMGNFHAEDSDILKKVEITQVQDTMEFIEVVEEVVQIKPTKDAQGTPVTALGGSRSLKRIKIGTEKEETPEKIIRVRDIDPDVQRAEDDPMQEESKMYFCLKESDIKDTIKTATHDPGHPISDITHLHYEEQNKLSLKSSHQSETVYLNSSDLQLLEHRPVVEVEIVKMSSETEEVKEKARELKELKNDVDQMFLNGRESSEEIVEGQKDKTDLEETTNKEDTEDGVKVGEILVVENIVDDTEEMEIEKEEAGALEVSFIGNEQSEQIKEKHTVKETSIVKESLQGTEAEMPSSNNEQEKISTIQQEKKSDLAFCSGSNGKGGDKRRSNYKTPSRRAGRLNDQDAESELTERALQSSSKKTIKATFKQSKSIMQPELLKHIEEAEKELKQTKSEANLTEKERVEENAENENGEVYNTNLIVAHQENEEEINIIKDHIEQPTNNDQALTEVNNKMEDGSQDKVTAAEVEAEKTTEDDEQISQIEETVETVASEKGMVLNDEERIQESAVTDEENMKEVQKETDTAQEIAGEKTQSLHLFESSEDDESDRSDVSIKLDEEEEYETCSVTPLRCSKRLKNQDAGGKLTKSVLRRSARLSNKAAPQQRHKPQIQAMRQLEEPEQQELKNDEVNIMLESEVAVGERMESETVHGLFAEGDPENRFDDHENIRREDVLEQDKMSLGDLLHGETEQICTNISGEGSAADIELSEHVKYVKCKVQKEKAATEKVHREDSMESTSTLAKEEVSGVLVDVVNVHPVTERKDKEETAATVETLEMDLSPITNDEQDRDIHTEKDVKENLEEITANTLNDKSTSQKLDANKTQEETQESTAPAQGDRVQESSEDISVCTSRNLRRRTLPVTPTPERKSRRPQNIYNETKVSKNTEAEISEEEVESVFTRYLRGRIVTVTPRRKSKHHTVTEKDRTAVEEVHGPSLKYDTLAISVVERKDQQQGKDIPGNDSKKMKAVTDGGKDKADDYKEIERIDEDILAEVDLPHENQEKEVRSANSKKGSDQQKKGLEQILLEKVSEKDISEKLEEKLFKEAKHSARNISITEAVLDQSEEAEGVEKRAARKRTITIKPASARRSKRLHRQDEGENDE